MKMNAEERKKYKKAVEGCTQLSLDTTALLRGPRTVGYARVSTNAQARDGNSLEAQEKVLRESGAIIVYHDSYTGTKMDRPELVRMMDELMDGDTVVVTKIDRLARSLSQGIELIERMMDKGVRVNVLNIGLLDNSSVGVLMRNMMLAFAQFERDMIVERTQEGKAIAKMDPLFREGRPPKYSKAQIEHACALLNRYSYSKVADMTGISKSTLVREMRRRKTVMIKAEGKESDICFATKTSEVCAKIQTCIDLGKSLKETIEYILEKYDGITEAYITEKYNSFSLK